jgi:2-methylcitrate dehydratase PrpD
MAIPMKNTASPLRALAEFAAGVRADACPDSVVLKARALLLYAIAVGVTSAGAPVLRRVAAALKHEYGAADAATCLADGSRSALGAAAFCNAVLCHVRIQDDAHPAGHMGTVIVPAALAAAEARGASGSDLLAAVIAGYEVALRIGRDHAADLSLRGFRTTPIYGAFGAAAAGARIFGLNAQDTLHALATATHAMGALREFADAGTDEYPFQAGYAARNGLSAALLAAEGIAGTATALTGRAGFFRAFGKRGKDYAARLLDGLGSYYETERVTYKPYPGGQWHRGVIRAFAALREQAAGAALETAEVRMHPFEARFLGLDYNGPFNTYAQAFFSIPFCAALAWLHGTVTFAALNRFDDPAVLDVVARTRVVSDGACERYKPVIRIALRSGRTVERTEAAGEDIYNLTWDIAIDMTRQFCAEAGVPQARADALIEAARRVDTLRDIAPLIKAATDIALAATTRPSP